MGRNYTRFVAIALVALSLMAVGGLDYVARPYVSFSFFYVLSVAIAVVLVGRVAGLLCSLAASGITYLDQIVSHVPADIALWNSGMRLGTLLVATFVVHMWWISRQESYAPNSSGVCKSPKPVGTLTKVLGTVFLVYVPMTIIASLDYWYGTHERPEQQVVFSFFYLLPLIASIVLTGWRGGAIYSAIASLTFMFLQHYDNIGWGPSIWNAFMRYLVLLVVGHALWLVIVTKRRAA